MQNELDSHAIMKTMIESNEVNAAGAPAGAGVQAPAGRPINDAEPGDPARLENGAAGGGRGASAGVKQRLGELSTDSREFASAAGGVVTDAVSGWVAGQYVDLGREKLAQAEPAKRFENM